MSDEVYRSWKEFESSERRRVGTFQLSLDDLAKDMYIEQKRPVDDDEVAELNFDS